jgi:hypothetical protein
MPARIPAAATPPESPSHHRPHPHPPLRRLRARPLPPFFTRKPPSASSNRRRSCSFPGPTTTLKGSPSSFAKTRALVPFRFLCPSTPTPSPLFSPPPAWNQPPPPPPSPSPAYTPSPEGLAGSCARPLLLEFLKPPPGGLIAAIWAGPIAPPAAGNPRTQDPVEDLAVIHPRSSGFGPGRPQGRNEGPLLIRQLLKPHRPSPPRQVVRRRGIEYTPTGRRVLRWVLCESACRNRFPNACSGGPLWRSRPGCGSP